MSHLALDFLLLKGPGSTPTFFSVFCAPRQLAGFSAKLNPSGPFRMTVQNVESAQVKQGSDPGGPVSGV